MDRTGKIMIPPRFDNARDFFQGLAAVQRKRKWSYINGEGDVAISGPFDDVGDFFEGLAPIRVGREWSYINTAGEMAIKPQFQAAAEFREGLARVYIWSSTRCEEKFYTTEKVPNPDGEFRLPEKIIPGDTWCSVQDGKFGDVDRNGNFVVTPRYVRAMDFSEGLAAILFT